MDATPIVRFRVVFFVLMAIAGLRFFTHGWIAADYGEPRFFFHYSGFSWVQPLPAFGMGCVYAALIASALGASAGLRYAHLLFALLFSYAHLCDKANYLNHYYLVILLAWLFVLLPRVRSGDRVQAWVLWLLRFQVGVVYVFGGIGKLNSDWLLHAEPLRIWLSANIELCPFFEQRFVAYAFSWAGALFDLSIVPFLLWRRSRPFAYAVLVVFHVLTSLLFHIGMFPWIMIAAATLFFGEPTPFPKAPRWVYAYVAVQVLLPLRAYLYPGNTLWTEEGFRFAWRVMLIEKSAELEYTVIGKSGTRIVSPQQYLTRFQTRMVASQPDMILELAQRIAKDAGEPVEVHADAQVSFNGRLRAPLIDTSVDLAKEEDTLAPKHWILPAPTGDPLF